MSRIQSQSAALVVVRPVLTNDLDYGDIGSDDGDDVPHDADLDDIPAEPQVNGDASEESTGEKPGAQRDDPEDGDEEDDDDDGEEYVDTFGEGRVQR